MKHVVIIGAGVGGLATACLLGKAGYRVSVYEKNDGPGGRAGLLTADGFRFDMGPSWYLMPEVFEHFFALLGEDVNKLLQLERLSPSYQAYFKGTLFGSVLVHGDIERDSAVFESFEPGAKQQLLSYLDDAKTKHQLAMERFVYRNYDSRLDLLSIGSLRATRKLHPFRSLKDHVQSHFLSPELQKIMQYPALFLGTDPAKLPATYSLLNYVDFEQGVYYPMGGMYTVVEQLVRLAESYGVQFEYSQPVSKIMTKDGTAAGIRIGDQQIDADIVISNAPIEHTEQALLEKPERMYSKKYWKRRTLAPSALLIHLGVKARYPELQHPNPY